MALGGGSGGGQARGVKAGEAYVTLKAKDDLSAHLKGIAGKFAAFGKKVLSLGGIGGLVGGFVGGLSFKETTDDLRKMSDAINAMGLSATGGSGLFGVLNQFSDIGENVEGLTQFAQKVQDAFDGVGEEPKKLFEGLSVSAKDLIDLPLDEKFLRIHAAIRELPQAQQQFKLSMLGGSDSMKKWLPLLDMSNEQLREQAKQLAFNQSELNEAARANRAITQAGAAVNRVWQEMAIALAPVVAELANMVASGLKPIAAWMQGRTLRDLWDELVARGNQAWVELKIAAGGTFSDIWDFFKSGWNSAVYVVKNLFADLAAFVGKAMADTFEPLWKLWEQITGTPAPARAVAAGLPAVAAGLRKQAQLEFDAAEQERKQGQADREATKARLRAEAQAGLDAVAARVEARRRQMALDDLLNTPINFSRPGEQLAKMRSAGTFGGAGSLFRQAFGVQAGEGVAKKQLDEQKKGNVLLKDVVKAVKEIPVPRFL